MNSAPYRVSPLSDIIFGVVLPRQLMVCWLRAERRFAAKWIQRPSTSCCPLNRLLLPAGHLHRRKLLRNGICYFFADRKKWGRVSPHCGVPSSETLKLLVLSDNLSSRDSSPSSSVFFKGHFTVIICLYDFGRWYMVCCNIDRLDVNIYMS